MTTKQVKGREVEVGNVIETEHGDIYVKEVRMNIQLDNRTDISLLADDNVTLVVDE